MAQEGSTGAAGPTGAAGAAGAQGPIGLTGAAGATGAVGATGATGPAGVAGPTGPAGATGANGATGATGAIGPQGPIGLTGATGATGSTGPAGVAGPTGATGAAGPAGAVGATGSNGATGAQGPPVNFRGTWLAGTTYIVGDSVFFQGSSYISLTNPNLAHQPDTDVTNNTGNWALLAQQGAAGVAGPTGDPGASRSTRPDRFDGRNGRDRSSRPDGSHRSTRPDRFDGRNGRDRSSRSDGSHRSTRPDWLDRSSRCYGSNRRNGSGRSNWSSGANRSYRVARSVDRLHRHVEFRDKLRSWSNRILPGLELHLARQPQLRATSRTQTSRITQDTGVWSHKVGRRSGCSGCGRRSRCDWCTRSGRPAGKRWSGWSDWCTRSNRASTGPTGPQGLNFRGAWNGGQIYAPADSVTFGGSSYIALQTNAGQEPDTDVANNSGNWALLAQRGAIATFQSLHSFPGLAPNAGFPSSYLSPIASKVDTATEDGTVVAILPLACTMTSITVHTDTPISPTGSALFTLRFGTTFTDQGASDLSDSSLSCTIGGSGQACSSSAGAFLMSANALFDVSVTINGTALATPSNLVVALVCQ